MDTQPFDDRHNAAGPVDIPKRGQVTEGSMLRYYSAALDEIYRLRAALAVEARTIDGFTDFKTFPKSQQSVAAASIDRMRMAVQGNWHRSYRALSMVFLDEVFGQFSGERCVTRASWEREVDGRGF